MNVTISVSDFSDAVTLGECAFVRGTVDFARKVIVSGGKVIFERHFAAGPAQVLLTISSEAEFREWEKGVGDVIAELRKMGNSTIKGAAQ